MLIGLLMVNAEDDILPTTIAAHSQMVDCFYALDGTVPNDVSREVCRMSGKCADYMTDDELMHPPYPEHPVDGYRQALYERAVADHGYDNWFLLLHADELWMFEPRDVIADHPEADGFIFRLPFYFPRVGEPWDDSRSPVEQLHWHLSPGWPEFRMFHGDVSVSYSPSQHFDTTPRGLRRIVPVDDAVIKHYPYRSPDVQRQRAALHLDTGFDPDNYRHIHRSDAVYWTDEMIAAWQRRPMFAALGRDE